MSTTAATGLGDLVEEPMAAVDRDRLRLHHAERRLDNDPDLGADAMSDPAQSHVLDGTHCSAYVAR
ncbi:MAG: hypothetical protein ACR2JU_08075 [Nocardioidaceae bacterium]